MWRVEDEALDNESLLNNESIFTLANGYLGVRGNFEEGYPDGFKSIRGTYINAFYDTVNIEYGESAFGFPKTQQKLVNVIDAQGLEIYLDGEKVSLFTGKISDYKRVLYLDKGFSDRSFVYTAASGKQASIQFRRLLSFKTKELFVIDVSVQYEGQIRIISAVNTYVVNYTDDNDPRVNHRSEQFLETVSLQNEKDYTLALSVTKNSKLSVCCASKDVFSKKAASFEEIKNEYKISKVYETNGSLSLTKYNIYTDSRRHKTLTETALDILTNVSQKPFESLLKEQEDYMRQFWHYANIEIKGNESLQQGLRFNLFQLLQSIGKEPNSNISAKGLSGEGYEGHYFWDTEIYIFPVFLMINPALAKNLLLFRYSILDEARKRAKEMGHKKGALFPWRTITGSECSAYFPAGTAQYHINADIAYSVIHYYQVTCDFEFLENYGAEILFETARLYADLSHFKDGKYYINDVTGPDEYTAIVNNNYYTNVMAKYNLKWAAEVYRLLADIKSPAFESLSKNLNLMPDEVDLWEDMSTKIYLTYDKLLDINPQDDSFLNKPVWDFRNTPDENYPLLLHYHPLTLYRHQVCKQADTVLAHFLLEDEQKPSTIRNSYHYYEIITTHDSSLSSCIFSIMASKIEEMDKAYHYFIQTARLDLDNTHANTKDGLHMANMGGTWMAIVYGFAGLRIKPNGLYLYPRLPKEMFGYSFSIIYHSCVIKVIVDKTSVEVLLTEGCELSLFLYNEKQLLKPNLSLRTPIIS